MSNKWEEFYSIDDIKKIQSVLLQSLDVFDELCKKLEIKYYLYGGSMLGAIKYNGFVPWDDDLDICLERKDYEKLLSKGTGFLNDKYELQHPLISPKSPYHYIKFRRKDTAMIEEDKRKLKINQGIYFDIYPLDNIPDDLSDYIKQKLEYDKWINRFQIRQNLHICKSGKSLKTIIFRTIIFFKHFFYKLLPVSFYVNHIDKISQKYNSGKTKRVGNLSFPYLLNYFEGNPEKNELVFEGRKQFLYPGYSVNMKNRYGDISLMPPASKRIGHKTFALKFIDEGK